MYTTILFDLDGTLTDPKEGITKSVQYALAKLGIDEPDCDQLTPFIGPPLMKAFQEFYGFDVPKSTQAVEYYRERFASGGLYENIVFPGIEGMLQVLRTQGRTLCVATSKPTVFAVKILEHFGLHEYFHYIVGSNLDGTRVEKSEVIEFALQQINCTERANVLMVGDRKHDIEGAKCHKIAVAAVAYGYGGMEELQAANPEYLLDSVQALHSFLCGSPPKGMDGGAKY